MDEVLQALRDVGLTPTESKIYLHLLKSGPLTAYKIAKDTRLYRANTYKAVDTLEQKNIISKMTIQGKQLVKAVDPEDVVNMLERQKERMQKILPLIERTFETEAEGVSIFTGIENFMNLLYKLLEYEAPLYAYDIPSYTPEIVKNHIMKFHKERIKRKIYFHHIYDYDAGDRIKILNKLKYTTAIRGKQNRHSLSSTIVCGNTTIITNWKKNVKTVVIVDKKIATTYRDQFQILSTL